VPVNNTPSLFTEYDGTGLLSDLCAKLWIDQKKTWPLFNEAQKELKNILVKKIICSGHEIQVQFNQRRLKNSSAKIDTASLKKRACFLCAKNLPSEQKGILYCRHLFILVNPAPVFRKHFTVVSLQHRKQLIRPSSFTDLLNLAFDLQGKYSVFYNGPECGASAPDHFHFQVIPTEILPCENKNQQHSYLRQDNDLTISLDINACLVMIIAESQDKEKLTRWWKTFFHKAVRVLAGAQEPMLNLICSYQKDAWRLMIFPRSAHRPRQFYLPDNDRLLISPGAIDMGGVIITALKNDFDRLDCRLVEDIYRQVSIDESIAHELCL
jgi:ATP adenylyltransferase/5',5'''-P-1,P-4-tetraphosphate phosphorylase II